MATQFFRFYGITKWCKVAQPDEKYNRYTLDLFLDDKSWKLYNKSGLQLKVREGEVETFDGEELKGEFLSFGRKAESIIKGELKKFDPPKLTHNNKPFNGLVGNGSRVSIDVAVYDTMKGKGHRWDSINVLNLVEYGGGVVDAHDDLPADEEEEPKKPAAKRKPLNDDLIPF